MLPRRPISPAYRDPDTSPATPRSLDWGHDRPRTNTDDDAPSSHDPCRRLARRRRSRRCGRIPRGPVAFVCGLGCGLVAADGPVVRRRRSSSISASPTGVPPDGQRAAPGELRGVLPAGAPIPRTEHAGALGTSDGVLPDGVTVFDSGYPAVSRLDPALVRALRAAATDAAGDGVTFTVDSGWRSRTYQEQLFRQAVSDYGSAKTAARWVAIPGRSTHESGDAVDIGPSDATAWLSRNGARYGLCQIYRNEPWHYELRLGAIDDGCPRMYADPTRDPRLQP